MELEPEKYQSLQELVKIQSEIATGRAELEKLKETIEEFKREREESVLSAVQEALQASKEALSEADKNRDTLASFFTEAQEITNKIRKFLKIVEDERKLFHKETDEAVTMINGRIDEANLLSEHLRSQRVRIESELGGMKEERLKLEQEKIAIKDKKETLIRSIDRLKKGKI